MTHQGIPISESLLLMNGIVFTCILLASLVIALVAFLLLRDKDASREKRKEAIRRLEAKARPIPAPQKGLKGSKEGKEKFLRKPLGIICSSRFSAPR